MDAWASFTDAATRVISDNLALGVALVSVVTVLVALILVHRLISHRKAS